MERYFFWMKMNPINEDPQVRNAPTETTAESPSAVETSSSPKPSLVTRGATIRARAETPRQMLSFNLLDVSPANEREVSFYVDRPGGVARAFTKEEAEKIQADAKFQAWLKGSECVVLASLDIDLF